VRVGKNRSSGGRALGRARGGQAEVTEHERRDVADRPLGRFLRGELDAARDQRAERV